MQAGAAAAAAAVAASRPHNSAAAKAAAAAAGAEAAPAPAQPRRELVVCTQPRVPLCRRRHLGRDRRRRHGLRPQQRRVRVAGVAVDAAAAAAAATAASTDERAGCCRCTPGPAAPAARLGGERLEAAADVVGECGEVAPLRLERRLEVAAAAAAAAAAERPRGRCRLEAREARRQVLRRRARLGCGGRRTLQRRLGRDRRGDLLLQLLWLLF